VLFSGGPQIDADHRNAATRNVIVTTKSTKNTKF
jgi:hypothetical protein